jgi:hypothetical protein
MISLPLPVHQDNQHYRGICKASQPASRRTSPAKIIVARKPRDSHGPCEHVTSDVFRPGGEVKYTS